MLEVARELHFLVADLRDLAQRALEIFLHLVAHGVKLQPDAADVMSRRRGPNRAGGIKRGGKSCGNRSSQKSSAFHGGGSGERRVGEECRSRGAAGHLKKKKERRL